MNSRIKAILFSTALLITFLYGCGPKINPQPYIMQAQKAYDSANTPEVKKYADDLLKSAETALTQAKAVEVDKEPDKAIALAAKAEIYATVSQIMAEAKALSESEINKAKDAEQKAREEIEMINARLQKAKILLPVLKADIEKIIKEFENLFEENKDVKKSEPEKTEKIETVSEEDIITEPLDDNETKSNNQIP